MFSCILFGRWLAPVALLALLAQFTPVAHAQPSGQRLTGAQIQSALIGNTFLWEWRRHTGESVRSTWRFQDRSTVIGHNTYTPPRSSNVGPIRTNQWQGRIRISGDRLCETQTWTFANEQPITPRTTDPERCWEVYLNDNRILLHQVSGPDSGFVRPPMRRIE